MDRPIRPVALVILTACMIYPGLSFIWQGLYPFINGDWFNLKGEVGPWMEFLSHRMGVAAWIVNLLKAGVGAAWVAGVSGLWAGDWRAYPLTLLAAAASLLHPGGPMIMAVLGLICLLFFRENAAEVPA